MPRPPAPRLGTPDQQLPQGRHHRMRAPHTDLGTGAWHQHCRHVLYHDDLSICYRVVAARLQDIDTSQRCDIRWRASTGTTAPP